MLAGLTDSTRRPPSRLVPMLAEFYRGHSPPDGLRFDTEKHPDKVAYDYVGEDTVTDLDPSCMNFSYSCQILLDHLVNNGDGLSPALTPWGHPDKGDHSGMCHWCQQRGVVRTSCVHREATSGRRGSDLFMAPAIANDPVDNGVGILLSASERTHRRARAVDRCLVHIHTFNSLLF